MAATPLPQTPKKMNFIPKQENILLHLVGHSAVRSPTDRSYTRTETETYSLHRH